MSRTVFQPTSVAEAIDLLAGSPPPFDSPTQHRCRTLDHLEHTFDAGRRRPEWVWAAHGDDGSVAAVAAALSNGPGLVLDHLGACQVDALTAVLRAASRYVQQRPDPGACLFVPAGQGASAPQVRPWTDALRRSGWQLLVERYHYEFVPSPDLAGDLPTVLRLEPLTGPQDTRIRALHREVTRGTLDAHDQALVARIGLEAATRESLDYLLDVDPWQCLRLAFADGPEPVGHVSWRSVDGGRGFLLFVGVAEQARGRGYGRQLLALATTGLLRGGSTILIADTDATNVPMAQAFAAIGWPHTEQRLDFVPLA